MTNELTMLGGPMSVLKNLRVLARYHVLTPVAVLAALAAGPSMAVDKVNNGTIANDTVNTGFGYTNNGTVAATGANALTTSGPTTFIVNSAGARITTTTGSTGVLLGGSIQNFRNDGTIVGGAFALDAAGSRITNLTNSGTITATDGSGDAIFAGAGGDTFSNSGMISGGGRGVFYANVPILTFTNSGTITGSSFGVLSSGTTNTFVNAGTIRSAGTAVQLGSGGNVTNSGVVSGGTASFIFANGLPDRLTLLTGSDVRGEIQFGGGADTLDFSGFYGTTVLTTDGQLETLVSGDRAFAATANNATVTIFDQTGASSMGSVTSGTLGSIQTAIANELGGFSAGNLFDTSAISGYVAEPRQTSAQAAANEAVLSELDTNPANGKVWGTVFGGVSGDSAPVALSNVYGGIVAGTHFQLDAQTRLGGLVGYSMSKFNVANGQQVIDSHTGTLGIYGKTDVGMIELNYALLGGGSSHSSSRQVVVGAAKENVTGSFASWFINPSLGISIPVMSDDTTEINVAASASYIYGGVGSYTESSANFTASVGAMPISVFEARLELNGEKIVGQTDHGDVRIRGKVGLLAEANMGSSNIPLTLNGTATTFANPGTTTYGAYAGAGLSADIGAGLVLDTGIDLTVRADGNNSASGKVSLIGSF